jgi:putative transposase
MEQQSIRKTYKYRLAPTPEQEKVLEEVLCRFRELYNAGLEERKTAREKCGASVTFAKQSAQLPGIKDVRSEYRDINAQVLQDVLHRLDKTFQAFFRRMKNGEKPGYPRFRGRDRYNSFTYPQVGEHGGAMLDGGLLSLSKIGRILIRLHRPLEGTPKTITMSRGADGWYACFLCADVPAQPLPATGQETGIDLGVEAFATLSDGTRIFHPGWYRKAERALKLAQRRIPRRKKGSNRRRKAVKLLAKAHLTVKRQRADFHHKVALKLVQTHDTIYHENLQVTNMVKHPHLAKSISDAGWGVFLTILTHTAAGAGRRVVAVNPAYISQRWSERSEVVQKGLSVRWHSCHVCGASLHRDHNAAKSRERAGQALRGGVALAVAENREALAFTHEEYLTHSTAQAGGFSLPARNSSGASHPTRSGHTVRHGPARPRATCPSCQAAGWSGEHPSIP